MRKYRRLAKKKRKIPFYKRKIFWISFLFFLFFSGNFYLITLSPFFQVREVEISGSEELKEKMKILIEPLLPKNLFFFQTRSIFLFDPKEIRDIVLEKFPKIERIEFSRKFPDKIELKIFEKNPVAVFCFQECFFVDKEGIAFEEIEFGGGFFFEVGEKIELGKSVFEKDFLEKILKIRESLEKDFKIELEKIKIVSRERINAKTKEGWEIYFNPQKDIAWQLIKLAALLNKEIPPEKRKNLEYIELRFGNFAPYKYQSME